MPFQTWNEPIPLESGLYVVSTPIGNLGDMTLRGVRTLISADYVAAEDTRVSMKLLNHFGIRTPMFSCHEHNENERLGRVVSCLADGKSVAFITDAGTPLISDPGYRLVRGVIEAGFSVFSVPGPTAATAALSISGFPTDAFTFIGFPPNKKNRRIEWIRLYSNLSHPVICYESPYRVLAFLDDAMAVLGDREAVLCRELTKRHEEVVRGNLSFIRNTLTDRERIRGEITLIIAGARPEESPDIEPVDLTSDIVKGLSEGESASGLAKRLAKAFGLPKREVYDLILQQKESI